MFSTEDRTAFDAALAEYMAAQRYVGDQAAAHLNMAVVYGNLAEEEIALAGQLYQQNAGGNPVDVQTAYAQAIRKATEKSFQEYQQALAIDPLFVPARINLAMLYDQRGQKEEAEAQFRQILEIEPDLAEVHYSLGLLIAENEDRLAEAVKSLETAARLAADNARIHYNLAVAVQKLGRLDDAEREYKQAYSLSPGTADFLNALAILYSQRGQWPQAIACADRLIEMEPGNPQWRQLREYLVQQSGAAGAGP
jgi:tetratricopeptide (TPR) repeat protein